MKEQFLYKAPVDIEGIIVIPIVVCFVSMVAYFISDAYYLSILIVIVGALVYIPSLNEWIFREKKLVIRNLFNVGSKTINYDELNEVIVYVKGDIRFLSPLIVVKYSFGKTSKIKLQKKKSVHGLLRYLKSMGVQVKIESTFKKVREEYAEFI